MARLLFCTEFELGPHPACWNSRPFVRDCRTSPRPPPLPCAKTGPSATLARLLFCTEFERGTPPPCWNSMPFVSNCRTSPRAPTCSGGIFDYAERRDRLAEVELELAEPNVWEDPERAQELGREDRKSVV